MTYDCDLCHDVGALEVPHPQHVNYGEWLGKRVTYAVACTCERGAKLAERTRTRSLASYEREYPDWRRLMEAKAAAERTGPRKVKIDPSTIGAMPK